MNNIGTAKPKKKNAQKKPGAAASTFAPSGYTAASFAPVTQSVWAEVGESPVVEALTEAQAATPYDLTKPNVKRFFEATSPRPPNRKQKKQSTNTTDFSQLPLYVPEAMCDRVAFDEWGNWIHPIERYMNPYTAGGRTGRPWSCPACTATNKANKRSCVVCSAPAPAPPSRPLAEHRAALLTKIATADKAATCPSPPAATEDVDSRTTFSHDKGGPSGWPASPAACAVQVKADEEEAARVAQVHSRTTSSPFASKPPMP
jgi:hypothetical protein